MIMIEVPAVSAGHKPLYFEDVTPEQRVEFAQKITSLLRQGHAIFLTDGDDSRLVKGYDPEANEFNVAATKRAIPQGSDTINGDGNRVKFLPTRIKASGKTVTAVAQSQGG